MTLAQRINDLLECLDSDGYDLVERRDYPDRSVFRFKKPNGVNIGAVTVFEHDTVAGDCPPRMYYTPAAVFDPAAGTGGTLTTIANPPYGISEPINQ